MQRRGVIPHDHIAIILPLDRMYVLRLQDVRENLVDDFLGFLLTHPVKVVSVGGQVQALPARTVVWKDDAVARHWVGLWVNLPVELRCR